MSFAFTKATDGGDYLDPRFAEHRRVSCAQPWLRAVTRHLSEAYPGAEWAFWQYSGTGLVPGIAGPVDLNAFAGTPEAWVVWLAANAR